MPCNIGYKSYTRIKIPAPQPQTFTEKSKAPDINAELLAKLGVEDETFLEWVKDLDAKPLLEEALKRALKKVSSGGIDFKVDSRGMLEAKGSFTSLREKKALSEKAAEISSRWQFEILGIVAQLLNYTVNIRTSGKELVLEAEEQGKSHPCNYIKVTKSDSDDATLTFEHFKSGQKLDLETARFLALARKLGVKVDVGERSITEGDPFPGEVRTDHRLGHNHSH